MQASFVQIQHHLSAQSQRALLAKLNLILVNILKHEWPAKWPTFIPDLVGASKASESLCQNNMEILKLLSEEVFDFSKGVMTQVKAQHLKDSYVHASHHKCSLTIV